jgi:hypothetical protein
MIFAVETDGASTWAQWANLILNFLLIPMVGFLWRCWKLLKAASKDARAAAIVSKKQAFLMRRYRRRMRKEIGAVGERTCLLQDRLNDIEPRVKAIWTGLLSRAEKEVLEHRHGEKNSPLRINDMAKEAVSGELLQDMRYYFESLPEDIPDTELAMKLEQHFGDRIVDEFCNPNGYSEFGCLVLFVAALRGGVANMRHEGCGMKA